MTLPAGTMEVLERQFQHFHDTSFTHLEKAAGTHF
jgi:hypothetical protein